MLPAEALGVSAVREPVVERVRGGAAVWASGGDVVAHGVQALVAPDPLRPECFQDGGIAAGTAASERGLELRGVDLALDAQGGCGGAASHPIPAGLHVVAEHGRRRVRQRELDAKVGLEQERLEESPAYPR